MTYTSFSHRAEKATQSFTLLSSFARERSPPSLRCVDERQQWESETGDFLACNEARLCRTRFVRESDQNKAWSGSDTSSRPKHIDDELLGEAPVNATASDSDGASSLTTAEAGQPAPIAIEITASLYAKLAS